MVGPMMTIERASHACDGMADQCSCISGQPAIGSITTEATANMRAITPRAERRAIAGFERTMYIAYASEFPMMNRSPTSDFVVPLKPSLPTTTSAPAAANAMPPIFAAVAALAPEGDGRAEREHRHRRHQDGSHMGLGERQSGQKERLIDDHAKDGETGQTPSVAPLERRRVALMQDEIEDDG
jgi:hypothetical protein